MTHVMEMLVKMAHVIHQKNVPQKAAQVPDHAHLDMECVVPVISIKIIYKSK